MYVIFLRQFTKTDIMLSELKQKHYKHLLNHFFTVFKAIFLIIFFQFFFAHFVLIKLTSPFSITAIEEVCPHAMPVALL